MAKFKDWEKAIFPDSFVLQISNAGTLNIGSLLESADIDMGD